MKRLLTRIAVLVTMIEVFYLAVVNVALNLPSTQDYLNQIDPDRFSVRWDRAWSWYPFSFNVAGLSFNGQTWSQQWQVSGPSAKASLALLPLLAKTVRIKDLVTEDIDVRFRPRLNPERDDSAVREFYPVIDGRDPNLPIGPLPESDPDWLVIVEVAQLGGRNDFWVRQVQATLAGVGEAIFRHRTGHGPLEISGGQAKAQLESLIVNGEQISDSGSIEGEFNFASFIPFKNRGGKFLGFLSSDAQFDLALARLDFLDLYLGKVSGMKLSGEGTVKGRVNYALGDLVGDTDLSIIADGLTVKQEPYSLSGAGGVQITVGQGGSQSLETRINFDSLSAYDESAEEELFAGTGVAVTVDRTARILPDGIDDSASRRIAFSIPKMQVADLSAYQRFIPDRWGVDLLGGVGTLEGRAELSANSLIADLVLGSENAEIKLKDESFETSLSFGLKLNGEADDKAAQVDISGTYLSLNDSKVTGRQGADPAPWQTRLSVEKGRVGFDLPEATDADSERAGFWAVVKEKKVKSLLATLDGEIQADLAVSDLDWVNVIFTNPYSLTVHNAAEIGADLKIRSGWFAEGSSLKMQPRKFNVTFLDYVAEGRGDFTLVVDKGGESPDLRLEAGLSAASLKLKDEEQSVIDQVSLAISADAKGVSLRRGGAVAGLDLNVYSARITDMSSYNHYLPKGSPLRLLGGEADLTAKVEMKTDNASGFVNLRTSRIDAILDDQPLFGTLELDIDINDGTVRDMAFDIAGSSLRVNGVQIPGGKSANQDWSGRIDLSDGQVVWKKPMTLDLDARIQMTDTRPLIAMFESHSRQHRWLERILTLENVRGEATVKVKSNEFLVSNALAKSDTIELGAKGLIRENEREGIFYARYGRLAGALKVENGKRNFDLIGATRKFENYIPGE